MMTSLQTLPSATTAPAPKENHLLTAALKYAARGWPVFPQHTPRNGRCSCGKPNCGSVGKHPRNTNGFNGATRDPEKIRRWWAQEPDSNIGLSLGNGNYCLDFDNPDFFQVWANAVGPLADTLPREERAGRCHVYFRADADLDADVLAYADADGKQKAIELKGNKSAVTVYPSAHVDGDGYKFVAGSLTSTPRLKPEEAERVIRTARTLNQKQDGPQFNLITAYDALQPQPPIDWICENILEAASVTVLVGDGGTGKTWAALDLGANVALGKAWLGHHVTGGPVLIVDEESGARRIARRMGKVLRAIGGDERAPLACVSLHRFDLRDAKSAGELAGLIQAQSARLVIIDALADVMPGADENAVKDVLPAMQSLRQIAELTGAALVVLHHTNKANGYRGSTAIKGAVENLVTVNKRESVLTFEFEKSRDAISAKFAAVMNFEDDRFYLTPAQANVGHKLSAAMQYVLRYLSEHGPSKTDDITGAADVCSEESARRAVFSLASQKLIERTDTGGRGGRGQSAVYGLTLAGQNAI